MDVLCCITIWSVYHWARYHGRSASCKSRYKHKKTGNCRLVREWKGFYRSLTHIVPSHRQAVPIVVTIRFSSNTSLPDLHLAIRLLLVAFD